MYQRLQMPSQTFTNHSNSPDLLCSVRRHDDARSISGSRFLASRQLSDDIERENSGTRGGTPSLTVRPLPESKVFEDDELHAKSWPDHDQRMKKIPNKQAIPPVNGQQNEAMPSVFFITLKN
jgi:hypothetical protein